MATLVLSAAGAALGGGLGGSFAGLSTLAVGRAAGAVLGLAIDQRLLGSGSEVVETGRVDRFRVMGSSEGTAIPRVFGRARVAGQLVWSSRFLEEVTTENVGGKGGRGGGTEVREYSYSISLAIALCEGEVQRVGRIWADGQPLDQQSLEWRLHRGTETQLPDPLIAAIEGPDTAPAYRGTAYVVIENLQLAPFGNRIPQFNFEVFRRPSSTNLPAGMDPSRDIRGVALIPGTGEYALETEPVYFRRGKGETDVANVHNDQGLADFIASTDQMTAALPNADAVSLVVSWFGDDLRCDSCTLRPKVEQTEQDGDDAAWRVSGIGRGSASPVSRLEGRPLFGGTPSDASVIKSIRHLHARGRSVMFYPFILMDILGSNALEDPWTGGSRQPAVPWRGRITLSRAPGRIGSPDQQPAARGEVEAFAGRASRSDFEQGEWGVTYRGPEEWSFRRFILHYAHLCAVAGGVDAFCIGSELRGLTQIRDSRTSYPFVVELRRLVEDVRAILGPSVRIGYAADWSEYFGHQPADGSGDVLFHLDPLWAHPEVNFVGIDNYMPLSDWRDESEHADRSFGSIYNLDYLRGNVEGGEGFDWYYASSDGRSSQTRLPIRDSAHAEDWVFRYKDLRNWWSNPHHNRPGGVRSSSSTEWIPKSKPFWFTEIGCPAVDKGTNQPNVFYDPKSSESFFPYFSNGSPDRYIQYPYLQALLSHWSKNTNNPISDRFDGRMVDLSRTYVWAWDARPWPDFPSRSETWIDGANYERGHWINGRIEDVPLSEVVTEICERSGQERLATERLYGSVSGFTIASVETARQSLQPLMLAYSFDGFAKEDSVSFASRGQLDLIDIVSGNLVASEREPTLVRTRGSDRDAPGTVTLGFVRASGDYSDGAVVARAPDARESATEQSSLPLLLSDGEARAIAERWLSEGQAARDIYELRLPLSELPLSPGDVVRLGGDGQPPALRVDRVEELGARRVTASRTDLRSYRRASGSDAEDARLAVEPVRPVHLEFLDLPLLTGDEVPHAPFVAASSVPWAGPVAVYSSSSASGFELDTILDRPSVVGSTLAPLTGAIAGVWCNADLLVRISRGRLESKSEAAVLAGGNALAIRGGGRTEWEVLQFAEAELVGPNSYLLRRLLRGQAGTDGVMPEVWPTGSDIVLLNGALKQLGLKASQRGLERFYRYGPAGRAFDHPSYATESQSFTGVGLRPYAPCHPKIEQTPGGDISVIWTRRTRIDGNSWDGLDVPLGEERELYIVRVILDGSIVEEQTVETASVVVSGSYLDETGPARLSVEIAQVSERYGPGPFLRIEIDE